MAALTASLHCNGMTDWIELNDQASRQYADATIVFAEWEKARARVQECSGGMIWRTSKGREYLIQTGKDNRQRSLGPRSPHTEAIYTAFISRKRQAQETLGRLRHEMALADRQNRALQVGDAPALLVRILTNMERIGLRDSTLIAGDCALLAYAAQARVKSWLAAGQVHDCEPIHVQILAADARAKDMALAALLAADKTFIASQATEGRLNLKNAQGATAEILYDGLIQILFKPDMPMAVRPFSVPLVATSGRMARMTAIPPSMYVLRAHGLAGRTDISPAEALQHAQRALAVRRLIKSHLPDWNDGWAMPTKFGKTGPATQGAVDD
ncbi:hypothetical protein [Cupriavidus pauculus]|nr:hypothetical protein [Cupriavidus pauculus]